MEGAGSNTARRKGGSARLADTERPITAPPAPSSQINNQESKIIDLGDLEGTGIDQEGLFHSSTDWTFLGKAMAVLQDQYEQCLQDIAALESYKSEALSSPAQFVDRLRANELHLPQLQSVYRIPEIDVDRFATRPSRRGLSKKEQNAEFLLARLKELQQRGSCVLPIPFRSDEISIDPGAGSAKSTGKNLHRDRFLATATEELPIRPLSATPSLTNTSSLQSSSNTASPKKKSKSHTTSPAIQNQTHNVPWTKEEKKRLNELLQEYPEEPIAARRYAKIAAALGTRTPTQVFTRVTKLMASKRAFELSDNDPEEQPDSKTSPEYKEYMKLKQALEQELLGAGTALVHCGIQCSSCNAHPIVGVRYRCLECAVDLCDSCYPPDSGQSSVHLSHRVQAVPLQPIVDNSQAEFDYLTPSSTSHIK